MTKAIVKKACALKRDSASDKLLRNVLDDICNKLDTAKKSSNNGKVPYGEAQKLVEEMQKILPKLNRNMVNYHLKKRESMATTTSDDEEPDLPGLDYGTDNEESDDEGNENTSIITTSPVLVDFFFESNASLSSATTRRAPSNCESRVHKHSEPKSTKFNHWIRRNLREQNCRFC
jgi:hypothetical protein